MDTATQAILGAAIGQAGFARHVGRRALAWGAVAGTLPDLDVFVVAVQGPFAELVWHRGPTHALWFGPVVGPLLGAGVWALHRRRRRPRPAGRADPGARETLAAWIGLFTVALFTHPLLDVFTAYGTQLLAPFSLQRFAWNGIAIIDPFYTLPLITALAVGAFLGVRSLGAQRAARLALVLTTLYLGYGFWLNGRVERSAAQSLAASGEPPTSLRAYPTIFQPWLRRVVARRSDEVCVGLVSSFRPDAIRWDCFTPEPPHPLGERLRATREGALFEWFAMGEVVVRVRPDGAATVVEMDDLRYGLPGPPDHGMWGVRARFDVAGERLGPVVRFTRPRITTQGPGVGDLFRAALGDLSALERR